MSLGINTTTPEGIVLAADSRQSYRNQKGMGRIGSDSASKVFKLSKKVGLIVTGLAFLREDGVLKNISRFIQEFIRINELEKMGVEQISGELKKYFETKYDYLSRLKELKKQVKAELEAQGFKLLGIKDNADHIKFQFQDNQNQIREGVATTDPLQFIVAGYNHDGSHQVCIVYVPGKVEVKRDSRKIGEEYGASWIGQTDVVSRIVLGFDPRIGNLPLVQKAASELGQKEVQKQLSNLEYFIQWGTMTLQDGIDFSLLAISTTAAIQRFSDGIIGDPGDMTGVGGPIDVAVITSKNDFVWISKKNLKAGNNEIDLEKL